MARLTLADLKQAQLETFKAFWHKCCEKDVVRRHAKTWHECNTTFWATPSVINALRNAGALVNVIGIDHNGNWAIEIIWYGDFHRGVFAVIGIPDPDEPVQSENE